MALKTKKTIMTVYTVLAVLASLGFSVYRTILLKQHYDPYDASFEHGSREVFSVFEYTLLAVSLICLTAAFFAMGSKIPDFQREIVNDFYLHMRGMRRYSARHSYIRSGFSPRRDIQFQSERRYLQGSFHLRDIPDAHLVFILPRMRVHGSG